jgi:hypothetical protein
MGFETPVYRLPDKRATIKLDELGLVGGEIDVSLRMPLALMAKSAVAQEEGDLTELRGLFLEWADASWNLTDHKGEVPVTEDGFGRLTPREQMVVIAAWLRGVVEPPRPLSRKSGSTAPSRARSKSRKS